MRGHFEAVERLWSMRGDAHWELAPSHVLLSRSLFDDGQSNLRAGERPPPSLVLERWRHVVDIPRVVAIVVQLVDVRPLGETTGMSLAPIRINNNFHARTFRRQPLRM